MTTSPEPADDGHIPPREGPGSPEQPAATPDSSANPSIPAGSEQPANPDDGLPEWEPLTPELVEDEAIRGDFVIRWAVVGLALLFGFSPISETRTLVHIRSGEYLATHGFLPPGNDVFSSTAADRRWINLSWLFDLAAAGVHAVAGGIGLSIAQGVLAGLTFGLLAHTYRSGIRSWWGSICAVLALLVCYPQFTSQPELITLLGMGTLLLLIVRYEESANPNLLWSGVAVVWLWSQFDACAFLGWLLLMAMALGESLRKGHDRRQQRALWRRVSFASAALTVVHPFLWESWLSPIRLFGTNYPALRQIFPRPGVIEVGFYPITFPTFWTSINHDSVAALVLLAATVVSLILNRERLHAGQLFAVVIFNLLGFLATHEMAAASLVNCAFCTINAQEWYRHRFGQVYSVDWKELLFSRGGRAVTVVGFFALAWLVISGRIDGPSGRRTGLGFHENLLTQMDSYRQISEHDQQQQSPDNRPFHFVARQGDLLIWAGQKSFIDTRAGLFAGTEGRDLIALHDRTRRAIQQKRKNLAGSGEPETWKRTFEKYQLTHTMPRLSSPAPAPDYLTFGDLLSSSDWTMTDLTPSTAVFYRAENQPPLNEFVAQNRLNLVKVAFRTAVKLPETGRLCAKPATMTDTLFSLRQPRYPAGIQLAAHYVQLAAFSGNVPTQMRAACATLAIRHATEGLREDSNSVDGYRIIGMAYQVLDRVEAGIMSQAGKRWASAMRYFETVAALQQAAILSPADPLVRMDLLQLFERTQRGDLALECIRHVKRLQKVTANSSEEERNQRNQLVNTELSLEETLTKIKNHTEQLLQNGTDRFQVAGAAYQAGAVLLGIRILEEEPIYKEENPSAKNALGTWLIEAGRIQEGLDTLEQVNSQGVPGWRDSMATALLINGEYVRAVETWRKQISETDAAGTQRALMTLPFVTLSPGWMGTEQYPFTHMVAAGEIVGNVSAEITGLTLQIGQAQLEQGDNAGATRSLQSLLDNSPTSPLRPLVKFYLELLTDKQIAEPSRDAVPQEEFEPLTGRPEKREDQ